MEDVKYPIELEVITPLSVGAGNDNEWTCGMDYVQKDNKVYVLDLQKVVAQGVDIDRLTQLFLKSDEQGIVRLLGSQIGAVSRYVFTSPVRTTNSIKTFLRTQMYDLPLVAGSSLKGAVRSALFNVLRTDEETNEEVFGSMKNGTDFMRFIRIADIELPATKLVNTKIFNLRKEGHDWYGGWKHGGSRGGESHTDGHFSPTGFNTLYECAVPGMKGYGSIALAKSVFATLVANATVPMPYLNKKQELMSADIWRLFQLVNDVTRKYLEKEKEFFMKYPAERSEELMENIDYLLSLIPDDGSSCLLKMSAGVGFHSITGDWRYDDYSETGLWTDERNRGKKRYKSRKTADYNGRLQLMGFVRLRCLSSEEAADAEQKQQRVHSDIHEAVMKPIREREAERNRKQEADLQRKLELQLEEQKQAEYRKLLERASRHYHDGMWDDAITILEQAAALNPKAEGHNPLMEQCRQAKAADEFRKVQAHADAQRFCQPLAEVIKGKTSAGNLLGTTVKWLKVEGHEFGPSEYDAFVAESHVLPSKEQERLKGRLSELSKFVGPDVIDKIVMDLGIV